MAMIVRELTKNIDERGFFAELYRQDWGITDNAVQFNMSYTYPGVVRAWHRHNRGQFDIFIVVKGSALIQEYDEENKVNERIVSSGERLRAIVVNGCMWHGFKALGNEPVLLIYGVTNLYDSRNPDEERRPWNTARFPDWNSDINK